MRCEALVMKLFFALSPCPICKKQASTARGCCLKCQNELFRPLLQQDSVALGPYAGKLELAIRQLKYHHVTALAQLFALELAKALRQQAWHIDCITAVPLHWRRYLRRGYNQSALIARALAQDLELPYARLLWRSKATRQQAKLNKLERQKNIADAFRAKPLAAKRILLVDDVITTGVTIEACRSCLLEAGAKEVKLVSVARGIQRLY